MEAPAQPQTGARDACRQARQPAPRSLQRAVARGMEEGGVRLSGQRVLALCSGGIDSVTLVDVLGSLPRGSRPAELAVLFLDHGIRDVSAERAAAEAVAARHSLPFQSRSAGTTFATVTGSLQAPARQWRLNVAVEVARERQATIVATGHTADDQLETMLYSLLAAGGLAGLTGIPAVRELASGLQIVRPLLPLSRDDIRAWAAERRLRWAEDPSNATTRYARNRIRAEVLPGLVAMHPGAGRNLERTRRQIAQAHAAAEDLARACVREWTHRDGGLDTRPVRELGQPASDSVIAAWLRDQGIGRSLTSRAVEAVLRLAQTDSAGGRVDLAGACVRREGYLLYLRRSPGAAAPQ